MSWSSRIANIFRRDRLTRDLDEELRSHVAEAIEHGRDPAEARRAFGSALHYREASRDIRLIPWLDSLRADAVFGWRQLLKKKATSAAAILSLALAIGACTSAFRLIDALLLRPLPISEPGRLYVVSEEFIDDNGKPKTGDGCAYPLFRQMRAAVKGQAELLAISYTDRMELTYGPDQEMEEANQQYVSGWMFGAFGLRPALGRLLTESDDLQPGAHPFAVLSYDYWTRRFARDPKIIGRTFRSGNDLYTVVGVAEERFTGTEPGTVTDIFLPTMMKGAAVGRATYFWFRAMARLEPGAAAEPVRQRLDGIYRAFQQGRAKALTAMPKSRRDQFVNQRVLLEPAAAGVSGMQKSYRRALWALAVLVGLVLLIACANVANLMTAQTAARSREMALRVSIGAGRWRLAQLLLVESAWLALLAAGAGALFAWWAAPFVVSMINPPNNPARLFLPADWRVLGFGAALALAVSLLFGLGPALRVSALRPASALRGGSDPHSRRLMHALIALQVAFCILVHFVGGLFVTTYQRLANQPTGFSSERILNLDAAAPRPQPAVFWDQVADQLRAVPGVESVALAEWPLMNTGVWNGMISINGAPPSDVMTNFLSVSSGWLATMRIPLLDGRDFSVNDPYPGVAIVNRAFAKQYFGGENPIGKTFEETMGGTAGRRFQIIGLAADALYQYMRTPVEPTAYFPFRSSYARGTFIVRTSGANPRALAQPLRREVSRARSEFHVSSIRTQEDLNRAQTLRERLLAELALFFAMVALLLAGVGLSGVLHYGVLQRRREIGIRMALGAPGADIARRVTGEVFAMVLVGAAAGLAAGMASVRYIESLLYEVKGTDLRMLGLPALAVLAAALVAAAPAVIRAVRIDPAAMLRAD